MKNKNILIIAGEPSGDMRAGELVKELRPLLPDTTLWGIGGDIMAAHGVKLIEHIRNLSIVGFWDVLKNIFKIRSQFSRVISEVEARKPDMAVLVDYPGFNLEIAKKLKKKNIPVVYYVIPQVWAWGEHRVNTIRRCVQKALVLFPFEETFLAERGIPAEFTGHPLLDRIPASLPNNPGPVSDNPVIALLPGSRKSEVKLLFPLMLRTARLIHKERPGARFLTAESSGVDKALYEEPLSEYSSLDITRFKDNTLLALSKADMVIVASGTATLETALMERPMIITYKAPLLLSWPYRLIVKTPFLGLVNIIAGKQIVPEFLQNNAVPEKMSRAVLDICYGDNKRGEMLAELKKVKTTLGEKGAARKAAKAVAEFYGSPN